MVIRFEPSDLELFAGASHDRNPLHTSANYSRRTPFGQPVVFGVLGLLAASASIDNPGDAAVSRISASFRNPLFTGIDYSVTAERRRPDQVRLTIRDCDTIVAVATITLSDRPRSPFRIGDSAGAAASSPTTLSDPPQEGESVSGSYCPSPAEFRALANRFRLERTPFSASQCAMLLWCSYAVGMHLPGERALFSQLDVTFHESFPDQPAFDFTAKVSNFDERFDLLDVTAELTISGRTAATATLSTFVRHDTPPINLAALHSALPPRDALHGKNALVIGGSRGFGAAIVAALASQACDVAFTYRTGVADATDLARQLSVGRGSVRAIAADATDNPACLGLLDELVSSTGRLDILVLSASPPLRPEPFAPGSVDRFRAFVNQSLMLVATPLAACLELLRQSAGTVVLISSAVASDSSPAFPPNWTHYVAAKHAAEGMVRALSAQTPQVRWLIARPPRLLTDQTNTPQGRLAAAPPEPVAAELVRRLLDPALPHLSAVDLFT